MSADVLQADFRLDRTVVHDGESLTFRVYTNHDSFRITDFESEFGQPDGYDDVTGVVHTVTGGVKAFTWSSVTVAEAHAGKVRLTIYDPDTRASRSFSAAYTAYKAFDLTVEIANDPAGTANITSSLPLVCGGEDFTFTVRSTVSDRLVLEDYDCEFGDGVLERGKTYALTRGAVSFTVPGRDVKVGEDRYNTSSRLWLRFRDPDTQEVSEAEAGYVAAVGFTPAVTVMSDPLQDGGEFRLRVSSNRPRFKVVSYKGEVELGSASGLGGGTSVTSGTEYSVSPVAVAEDHTAKVSMVLQDSEYTGRTVTATATYRAAAHKVVKPTAIIADVESVSVNYDENNSSYTDRRKVVSVSFAPADAEGGIDVSLKDGSVTAGRPDISVNGMKVYVGGTLQAGANTIVITSTADPSVRKEIPVYVRHRLALQVYGSFYNSVTKNPCSHFGGASAGWYGIPEYIRARLVTWDCISGTVTSPISVQDSPDRVFGLYSFSQLMGDAGGTFSVQFRISVPAVLTSDKFYGPNGGDPKRMLYGGTSAHNKHGRPVSATMPSSPTMYFQEGTAALSAELECRNTAAAIRDMDNYGKYGSASWNVGDTNYNVHTVGFFPDDWGSVSLSVNGLTYDRDRIQIEYIMYMFQVPNACPGEDYWWKSVDNMKWIYSNTL